MKALFIFSSFLSAYLLFVIQPVIGKMVLPFFGGSSLVWNSCMIFFQAALLLGYVYVHLSSSHLPRKAQVLVHLFILLLAWFFYPIELPANIGSYEISQDWPIFTLWKILFFAIGPVYIILSSSGPLIQKWFSYTQEDSSSQIYKLYSSSNLGSVIGLLIFPFALEPFMSLNNQSQLWFALFGVLSATLLVNGYFAFKSKRINSIVAQDAGEEPGSPLKWFVAAFIPSALLHAVTSHLTTNVASIPLLWIVPLLIYLLTFVAAFSGRVSAHLEKVSRISCLLIAMLMLALVTKSNHPLSVIFVIHLLGLSLIGLTFHGRLYSQRPDASSLTKFYLITSLAGVLGGVFTTLIAPMIFDRIIEYPLLLILSALLRTNNIKDKLDKKDYLGVIGIFVFFAGVLYYLKGETSFISLKYVYVIYGAPILYTYRWVKKPKVFSIGLASIFISSLVLDASFDNSLYYKRNFYGVTKVSQDKVFKSLIHGDTVHGKQFIDKTKSLNALTYYSRSGPMGDIFNKMDLDSTAKNFAVLGLGVGTMASYAKAGESWKFYEINPDMKHIANDKTLFTFLAESRATDMNIIMGDARLNIEKEVNESFDFIFMDIFSSDSIPVHLVTNEALKIYLKKLNSGGVIAFNTSNRYLRIDDVLCRLAKHNNVKCFTKLDKRFNQKSIEAGVASSRYVIIFKDEKWVTYFEEKDWIEQNLLSNGIWSDDFSNIFETIIWSAVF